MFPLLYNYKKVIGSIFKHLMQGLFIDLISGY